MVPEDARPVVFEREYHIRQPRKRWVTREKTQKAKTRKLGRLSHALSRVPRAARVLELREMSTRESAVWLARGRSPRLASPARPPPSPPRAARRGAARRSCFGRLRSRQSRNRSRLFAAGRGAAASRGVVGPDTQCVFVRVAIPRGTPASRVRVQSETRSLHVRVVPEKTKAKWYGVSDDGSLRVTDTDATLHGAPRFAEKNAPPTSDDARRVGGALSLPCVAGDTVWTIDRWSPNDDEHDDEHDIVSVVLTKASRTSRLRRGASSSRTTPRRNP